MLHHATASAFNITKKSSIGEYYMEQTTRKTQESMEKTAHTMSDTVVDVLDRLASTKSQVKLSFEDLTLDTGVVKAKMTGAVVLETVLAKDIQTQTSQTGGQAAAYSMGG